MRTMKQLKRSMIAMLLVVCMICTNTLPAFADQAVASTMRLAKTEGKVSVTNKNGRDMGTMADMKLFNGYNLGTEQASYAWIGLDDSKIIKLDAVSEAEIQKKGKDLEVLLNSGNLFFNVTESLKADETLNIRTSTMVTGIRGTCGWVKVLDSWRTEVFILEGSVECWVMDPVTGQAKTVRLGAGQKATFVVYDQMREGDKCDIIMGTYGENDIDPFVAVELLNDPDLCNRVDGVTGLNIGTIISNAEARLDAEEQEVAQKNQVIQNQLFNQPNLVKDPVFETSNDDGGQSSGGSSTPPVEEPEEEVGYLDLYMPISASELNKALQNNNVRLHVSQEPDATENDNVLNINTTVTVPERGVDELVVDRGVTINVESGSELRVNGTLKTDGNVVNNGMITNTSMNTLDIGGTLTNNDGAEINNTGRIVTTGGLNNTGDVYNFGTIEGTLGLTGGSLSLFEGSVLDSTPLTIDGSVLNLYGSELSSVTVQNNGELVMYDGTVAMLDATNANVEIHGGEISSVAFTETMATMFGGTVTNGMVVDGDIPRDEEDNALPSLFIMGGTINSGSSDAAILVNMSVDTANSDIPNVIIASDVSGDNKITIDAESESASAIKVLSGQVEVDEGSLGTSLFLKAKNLDNIVNGREALEDMYVSIYALTGENNDNFMDLTMTHSLYANEGEGGYLLKVVEPGLQDLIDRASSGETIQTIQMKGNDRTERSYSVDSGNIVLDLNGNILDCGGFSVGEDAVLKVIDTKNNGTWTISGILENSSELTLESVEVNTTILRNYGNMEINKTDVSCMVVDGDVTAEIENSGTMTANEGTWTIEGTFWNYGTAKLNDLNVTLYTLENYSTEQADVDEISETESEDNYNLIINDGTWTFGEPNIEVVDNYNNGSMFMSGVDVIFTVAPLQNFGILDIEGGSFSDNENAEEDTYAPHTLIDSSGTLNVEGATFTRDKKNMFNGQSLLAVGYGKAKISGGSFSISGDDVAADEWYYGSTLIMARASATSVEDEAVWSGTIMLDSVTLDSGTDEMISAIYLYPGFQLIIEDGTVITSSSKYGAIWCEAASDDYYIEYGSYTPIKLNGVTITNTYEGAGVINQHSQSYSQGNEWEEFYSTMLLPNGIISATLSTSSNASYTDLDVSVLAQKGLITNSYISEGSETEPGVIKYMVYTPSNATASVSLMSLRPATPSDAETVTDSDAIEGDLPDENDDNLGGSGNDDVIGDSSDDDDDSNNTSSGNIETATGADATEKEDNTETASGGNATGNGEPMTGAPAAIPLAAALLGIWMSMPKEYKRRNGKEC